MELHTDNLEKHVQPRPKVHWPTSSALLAHDAQVVASGITTVLDAIAVGVPGRCERLVLNDCGHAPHRERPDEVLERETGFLRDVLDAC